MSHNEDNVTQKNPLIAILLSLIPGLSLLYVGRRRKAFGLFVIDAGIIIAFIFADSYIMRILMAGIYCVTFLPACLESYQISRYGKNTINTSARWYVTLLLLTTGFAALPMLWNSDYFSRRAKIGWSVAVPVLAMLFFSGLAVYWHSLNHVLRSFFHDVLP